MSSVRISAPELVVYGRPDHPLAGRYQILHDIGAGGMAFVFAARDLKHERVVAVKVLRQELASTLNTERFTREILIAAGLTHPNILPIHDSGTADGFLYYVMPYVDGETLVQRIEREQRLPIDDVLRITRDVGAALQYAHERGVVHRDIKPANVLLPGGVAVVADFGLARAVERDPGAERLTQAGVGLGTPTYMSPEQGTGERDVDARSDQYSLACTVYEMLTGQPPFDGATFPRLLMQHLTSMPEPARRLRPEIPVPVEAALAKALAKSPADRFASVEEFVEALDPTIVRRSGARALSRPRMQSPAMRRWAGGVVLGAAAIAGAVAGGRWLTARSAGHAALDANLLVVAPFEVFGNSLTVWREGLVDILSRDFDGAGPLRTVSPSMVMRVFSGRADKTTAVELARSTHAGLVVYGQLMEAGPDSVRATVTVRDAARDSNVAEFEVRSATTQMDRMADSIAVLSLRQLGNSRSIAAVPRAFFGARSLPALKEFLQGEQLYRRNDFRAARPHYERALVLDSTFALAYHRMRGVLRGLTNEGDSLSLWYAARAGAANRGTAPRDSMLILADSLAVAHRTAPAYVDSRWLASVRRRLATLDAAARRYPEDPEVWTELGEARVHYGERVGIDDRRSLDAFERALSIDSTYGPAFFHAIELAIPIRGAAAALPLVQRYRRVNPSDRPYGLVEGALRGASVDELVRELDRIHPDNPYTALLTLRRYSDDADVYGALYSYAWSRDSTPSDSARERVLLVRRFMFRGRLHDAFARVDSTILRRGVAGAGFTLALAEAGAMPKRQVRDEFAHLVREHDMAALPVALPWWQSQGDTASLNASIAVSVARQATGPSDDRLLARYSELASRGYLALARGDTAVAIRSLLALPDSALPYTLAPVRISIAHLLLARGMAREAAVYLDSRPPNPQGTSIWEVRWQLERARAALKLGDAEHARASYAFVAAAWSHADAEFQKDVTEAQHALSQPKSPTGN